MGAVLDRIERHLDAELSWILTETSSAAFANATADSDGTRTVKRGLLCKAIGAAIGSVLLEREGDLSKDVELSEFEDLAWKAAGSGSDLLGKESNTVSVSIAELCVSYMEMRKMGMPSPFPSRTPRSRLDDYNPFGNEGGFCNPRKLKALYDD
ncbi:hypothetical protein G6L37_00180 [Agrobacterium rubi]|nr:hypothetical protein [Agrobacterium rubi]NTF23667.1 hypothetical protein [Agrobacterium rubi]